MSVVAIVETVWVLDRAYSLSNAQVAAAIERILQTDVLTVEDEQQVFSALMALKQRANSFADALIAALGDKAGCTHTVTFDQTALVLRGFRAL